MITQLHHLSILNRIFIISFAVLFISSCVPSANAQSIAWQWVRHEGGTNGDVTSKLATDASGNLYATGHFRSTVYNFGDTALTNRGGTDCFFAKYDSLGNLVWGRLAAGSDEDIEADIAVDAQGNVYATGYFYSDTLHFDGTALINHGPNYSDVFIVKYDSAGHVIWAINFEGNYSEKSYGITAAANAVYVSGTFSSPAFMIGSTTLTSAGSEDVFVAKLDANGNALWAKSHGGIDVDVPGEICGDASGNIVLCGQFKSATITFGSTTLTKNSGIQNDAFLVKYNSSGTVLWANSGGGIYNDIATDVDLDISGNVYLTGDFSGTATFGTSSITSAGGFDAFTAKYNSSGTLQWIKSLGGASAEYSSGIAVDPAGSIYITGDFMTQVIPFGSSTLESQYGFQNYYVACYSNAGIPMWAKDNPVDLEESMGYDVAAGAGKLFACGFFRNAATFQDSVFTSYGFEDVYIGRLGLTIGINEPDFADQIILFPNPSNGLIHISSPVEIEKIEVLNITGQVISHYEPHIPITEFPFNQNGVFYIKIGLKEGMIAKKIISIY